MITFRKEVYAGEVNASLEVTVSYADATPEQIAANSILVGEIAAQIRQSELNVEPASE